MIMIKGTTNNPIITITIEDTVMIILNKITIMIIKILIRTITLIRVIIIQEEILMAKEVQEETRLQIIINTKRKKIIKVKRLIKWIL